MFNGLYLILTIFSVIAVVAVFLFLKREVLNPYGRGAEKPTARILSQFALIRGFKVLSGVKLKTGRDDILIENMLIGYFGVLLVGTLGARGEYYGTLNDENWSLVIKDKKISVQNPIKVLSEQESALRNLFSSKKIYNVPIEHVVYLSRKSKKTGLFVTNNGEILFPGKLSGYLAKTKFEKDLGLDVKLIAETVLSEASGS